MRVALLIVLTLLTIPGAVVAQDAVAPRDVVLGTGRWTFTWDSGWPPGAPAGQIGNTHGDILTLPDGRVLVNTDTADAVVVLDGDGVRLGAWGAEFAAGIHGMTLARRDGQPVLWLAHTAGHEAVATTLDGEVLARLGPPEASGLYGNAAAYNPTAVAVGPDGRLFVADGYGTSWIHLYDALLNYLRSFGGPGESPENLRTPHGLLVHVVDGEPALIVADRENGRLAVFDMEGRFLRVLAEGLRRPCGVKVSADGVFAVPELAGRVTLLDGQGAVLTHLGENPDPAKWAAHGVPPDQWLPGAFTAPHGVAWDGRGNLMVMDWNRFGRVSRLLRQAPAGIATTVEVSAAQVPDADVGPDMHGPPGPSGAPLLPEQAAIDVFREYIWLLVDPDLKRIDGMATIEADVVAPLADAVLHLDERLEVRKVSAWTGSSLSLEEQARSAEGWPFIHADGLLRIPLLEPARSGDRLNILVEYGGKPREAPNPPWDGGFTWAETADGRPWIATSCQGEGADLWWPCKDHPSDKPDEMALFITVPEGLVVASNGKLYGISGLKKDGWNTYEWYVNNPISNYAVALNIAPYVELREEYTSVDGTDFPVQFWVLPEDEAAGRAFMPEILDHLAFFEETLGPYPWRSEKYGVAQTPHLGMEHQSIIAYGYEFQQKEPGYDWLHHHELSHEWWGNLVTCADWKDMWIHEGFGTYMQALYLESRFGEEAYRTEMAARRANLRNRRAVAPRGTRDSKQIYFDADGGFDNDIYDKGAFALHALRWEIGDEDFFESLRRFAYPTDAHRTATDGSQVRLVDTEDYVALVSEITDRDLAPFFEVYLRQPVLPALYVERDASGLTLRWDLPMNAPFETRVPLLVDGEPVVVDMAGGRGRVELALDASVLVDPDGWLLRAEPSAAELDLQR